MVRYQNNISLKQPPRRNSLTAAALPAPVANRPSWQTIAPTLEPVLEMDHLNPCELIPARHFSPAPLLLVDISVDDVRGESSLLQRRLHRLGHHHRAMLPARTAERYRQIAFPFLDVVGNQVGQEPLHAAQKLSGLGERPDITTHLRVFAGEALQLRYKMWIRQEAHVEHQVGIRGHPKFIAETHQRD